MQGGDTNQESHEKGVIVQKRPQECTICVHIGDIVQVVALETTLPG